MNAIPGLVRSIHDGLNEANESGFVYSGDPKAVDPSGWAKDTFPKAALVIAAKVLAAIPPDAVLVTEESLAAALRVGLRNWLALDLTEADLPYVAHTILGSFGPPPHPTTDHLPR